MEVLRRSCGDPGGPAAVLRRYCEGPYGGPTDVLLRSCEGPAVVLQRSLLSSGGVPAGFLRHTEMGQLGEVKPADFVKCRTAPVVSGFSQHASARCALWVPWPRRALCRPRRWCPPRRGGRGGGRGCGAVRSSILGGFGGGVPGRAASARPRR